MTTDDDLQRVGTSHDDRLVPPVVGTRGGRTVARTTVIPAPAGTPARMPARRPRSLASGVLALVLAGLTACTAPAAQAPDAPPAVTVTPTIEPSRAAPPEPVVPVVWPLTGVPTAEVAQRPAVAVKVENTAVARPQSGLDQADVVWETIVEFEVSRLIAVFHSQVPTEVGPIRSVRPMDPLVVSPLHGLLAFSGGQPGILDLVADSPVQAISHDAGVGGMYRLSGRAAPHNVYGSVETFLEVADAEHQGPPPQQFAFALRPELATAVLSGTPAAGLSFRLSGQSSPSWEWDAATGTWLRSEGATPSRSAGGARLAAVNVVSVTAAHPATEFGAQGGAAVPTYELVGEGQGTLSTGGMTVPVVWRKAARDAPMELVTADGRPALLAPGVTWVELVPAGTGSLTVR